MGLDIDQLNQLSDQQKAAYMRQENTFESDGWKDVVAWAEQQAQLQGMRVLNAKSWDESQIAKGARAAFMAIMELQDSTEKEYAALAEEQKLDAQTEDEQAHE